MNKFLSKSTIALFVVIGAILALTKTIWIPVIYCLSGDGASRELCRLSPVVNGNVALASLLLLPVLLYALYGFCIQLPHDAKRLDGLKKIIQSLWPPIVIWLIGILWFRPIVMFSDNVGDGLSTVVRALDGSYTMLTLSLMIIGLIGGQTLKLGRKYFHERDIPKTWWYGALIIAIGICLFGRPFVAAASWYSDFIMTMGFLVFPLILFLSLVLDRTTIWWKKFLWLALMMVISGFAEYYGYKIGNPGYTIEGHYVDRYQLDGLYPLLAYIQATVFAILGTLLFVVFRAKHPVKSE